MTASSSGSTESQSKYSIRRLVLGNADEIVIAPARYEELRQACAGVIVGMTVEEKFDVLMEDYAELEIAALERAARNSIFGDLSWESMAIFRGTLNRRLLHVMTSSRMYLDQLEHELSGIFGKASAEFAAFRNARQEKYDTRFSFRLMEALRNYSQHRSLPVFGLKYPWTREGDDRLSHSVEYSLNVAELAADPVVNAKFKAELEALRTDRLPLGPLVREYIDALSRIHLSVRESLRAHLQECLGAVEQAVAEFVERYGTETAGLCIANIRLLEGEERGLIESHPLHAKPSKRILYLEAKNPCTWQQARQRVVSG